MSGQVVAVDQQGRAVVDRGGRDRSDRFLLVSSAGNVLKYGASAESVHVAP
jgi:hypothetical protein